jgi:hypothetical protein
MLRNVKLDWSEHTAGHVMVVGPAGHHRARTLSRMRQFSVHRKWLMTFWLTVAEVLGGQSIGYGRHFAVIGKGR